MQCQDLFPLGRLVATPRALEALARSGDAIETFIARHATRDWGEVCEEDKHENELSLARGFRLLSAYTLHDGNKLWVITEGDRSATTVLLPEEY
jgi:hypothetical protein